MKLDSLSQKLYQKFGLTALDISSFNLPTTAELILPQNHSLYENEISRLRNKASFQGRNLTFNEIKRLDYIAHKREEKTKPDRTPYRTGTPTYRASQKEPTGNGSHRRVEKYIPDF